MATKNGFHNKPKGEVDFVKCGKEAGRGLEHTAMIFHPSAKQINAQEHQKAEQVNIIFDESRSNKACLIESEGEIDEGRNMDDTDTALCYTFPKHIR